MPPVKPMLAKPIPAIPADGDLLFEPKWDGFRAIVFRDGDEIELGSRNERPLTRYFPEILPDLARSLPHRCVVDGELILATDGRLNFDGLQQRIHPAASRVEMLAEKTPASFVAFDLLAEGDDDLTGRPLAERRERLETALEGATPPVHLTPATKNRVLAQEWFERFEGAGLDGLIVKPLADPYVENKRVQLKVKHVRTADAVVAGYRMHKDGQGVGSLLLGLHDGDGILNHVGVAASFTAKRRAELLDELAPYRIEALDGHPWAHWARAEAHSSGRKPGGLSRWNANKDLSWEPLRCDLVAEVKYQSMLNGRFRATTRWITWRPDRTPESCGYDQLEEPTPVLLDEIFESSDR